MKHLSLMERGDSVLAYIVSFHHQGKIFIINLQVALVIAEVIHFTGPCFIDIGVVIKIQSRINELHSMYTYFSAGVEPG